MLKIGYLWIVVQLTIFDLCFDFMNILLNTNYVYRLFIKDDLMLIKSSLCIYFKYPYKMHLLQHDTIKS